MMDRFSWTFCWRLVKNSRVQMGLSNHLMLAVQSLQTLDTVYQIVHCITPPPPSQVEGCPLNKKNSILVKFFFIEMFFCFIPGQMKDFLG